MPASLSSRTPRRCAAVVVAAIACAFAVAPGGALGSAADDLNAVVSDYQAHGHITACLFTKQQLQNARAQVSADIDRYVPEFRMQLDREIQRLASGGCSGATTGGGSAGLRITRAKGKGSARRESVTLKNGASKKINVHGYALRDKAGKKLRLPAITLGKGRTLRVITGCAKGKHKASRRGSRYYACKKKEFYADKGDVAELLSPGGTVVARRPTT